MKERYIYTERIHHLTCSVCKNTINTNDCSHEITKYAAAIVFESAGWNYIKAKGWLCPDCLENNNSVEPTASSNRLKP